MVTTRTIGPLHLEDLEPHRFEDLIRQLIYDFRSWRALEFTGRSGSDDGFDARGFEVVADETGDAASDGEETDERPTSSTATDRLWMIQCKREKTITPKKVLAYLNSIPEMERASIHGLIFAAACDFSKKSRDNFRTRVREFGLGEGHLWGKAEVEDMLFQPKNDHLLFAYFGVSLQVRRRSLKTEVRSRLATKRKAHRTLQEGFTILVRDATDERYPHPDEDRTKRLEVRRRWTVLEYKGPYSDGLHFLVGRHFAYLADDGQAWDYSQRMNDARPWHLDHPWREDDEMSSQTDRSAAMEEWDALPEHNKAWYETTAVLPYENVLDIDEKGDEFFERPHIYTTQFDSKIGPFRYILATLKTIGDQQREGQPKRDTRIERFKVPTIESDSTLQD